MSNGRQARNRRAKLEPGQDPRPIRAETRVTLVASFARGRSWLDEIVAGTVKSVEQIAARDNCSIRQVNMTISLAFLAPELAQAVVEDDCLAASASLVYAMLLPSGPASTRCSVCRSDSGDLHAQLRSGARNGFAGPRDWESKSTLARPLSAPETARPASEPRKCPQIAGYSLETRKRRFGSDCVVGPGGLEPPTRLL